MKGHPGWDYKPYVRMCDIKKKDLPVICRLAPYEDHCEIQWMDHGDEDGQHQIICHQRGTGKPDIELWTCEHTVDIKGLLPGREYEVRVLRSKDPEKGSDFRFFRAGEIIGTVIDYLHPHDDHYAYSGRYLCSPCILRTKKGRLLVSMDVYGLGMAQNLTILCKSDDDGSSWQYLCELFPCFWGKLFEYEDRIYMLSMTAEYGELQIGYSEDEGETFCKPVTLFPGCGIRWEKGMHQAPTPVVFHEGRIWTAVDYGSWECGGHESAIISASLECDLMDPFAWVCSEFVPYDRSWPGAVPHSQWGGHEGNAVIGPDGEIYDFLRYQISNVFSGHVDDSVITHGKAFILKLDKKDPEKPMSFYKFVDFNGGMSKFVIRKDEITGFYISLVNEVVDDTMPSQRNILSLSISRDMVNWRIVKPLIDASEYSAFDTGFQYVDFIIDGEDILYASRTAFNGAHNFHDSNYITFHKLEDFRQVIKETLETEEGYR